MGGGNGCKAAQKRERAAKNDKKGSASQLKVNEAAKNTICSICRTSFLCTASEKVLKEHAEAKHSKDWKECFPDKQ